MNVSCFSRAIFVRTRVVNLSGVESFNHEVKRRRVIDRTDKSASSFASSFDVRPQLRDRIFRFNPVT